MRACRPRSCPKQAAVGLLGATFAVGSPASPLLEEELHSLVLTLLANILDPIELHRPRLGAGLAPDDHPMDVAQVEFANVFEERLDGQKADARIDFA